MYKPVIAFDSVQHQGDQCKLSSVKFPLNILKLNSGIYLRWCMEIKHKRLCCVELLKESVDTPRFFLVFLLASVKCLQI